MSLWNKTLKYLPIRSLPFMMQHHLVLATWWFIRKSSCRWLCYLLTCMVLAHWAPVPDCALISQLFEFLSNILFRGFSQDDLHLQKRAFQQDEPRLSPLHKNNMFRPSGKSIFSMLTLWTPCVISFLGDTCVNNAWVFLCISAEKGVFRIAQQTLRRHLCQSGGG